MSDYKKLIRTIDKELISIDELRLLAYDDLVVSASPSKQDDKYPNCLKYEIRLENEEIYWVYVKR